MECKVSTPEAPLSWWSSSNLSQWTTATTVSVTSINTLSVEERTVEQWHSVISETLSLPTANWELCTPISTEYASTSSIRIFGRVVHVDFLTNNLKLVLHPDTTLAILTAYESFLQNKDAPRGSMDELLIAWQALKTQLDAMVISLSCTALLCTTGSDGAGNFLNFNTLKSDDESLPMPKLDLVLGLNTYKGRGLSDLIQAFFTAPIEPTTLIVKDEDSSTSTCQSKRPDPLTLALEEIDDLDIALMSPERRSWVQYRINSNLPKRKRTIGKQQQKGGKLAEKQASELNRTKSKSSRQSVVSPRMQTEPFARRPANIYEDARGGKRRRPSFGSKVEDDVIHTLVADIQAGMQKQRLTPDYASSDSGIGLLSTPGGSRCSRSPDFEAPGICDPSALSYDIPADVELEWHRKRDFNIQDQPTYYDSSSDDEDLFIPPSRMNLSSHKKSSSMSHRKQHPSLTLSIPNQQMSPRKMAIHQTSRQLPSIKKGGRSKKLSKEAMDIDYTDFSDLEPDSDTPIYELLVDSEDEADHKRRKLARRERKAEKRQRSATIATSTPNL